MIALSPLEIPQQEPVCRGKKTGQKNPVDEFALLFYYRLNTGKEVIQKFMSSNHSEVAET